MADITVDGRTTVWFLPTIASAALAPTVAEITAGIRISKWMTPTGLAGFEAQQAEIDNSGFESTYDTKLPGRKSYSGTSLTFKEQSGDSAYTAMIAALAEYTDGFVAIRDDVLAETAVSAGTKLQAVHPVRTGLHAILGRGEANSLKRRQVMTPVTGPVKNDVVVLA